jgi:hypothetical protein
MILDGYVTMKLQSIGVLYNTGEMEMNPDVRLAAVALLKNSLTDALGKAIAQYNSAS